MKVTIYAKDSDDEQIAELRAWVVARGYSDIIEYRDITPLRGRSVDKGLTRLLQDAKNRKFGILYVNKLEQLGQSYPPNVLLLICILRGCGVRLISRAETWTDLSDIELGIVYMAYCQHLDSEAHEMSLSLRSRKTRAKKNYKPQKDDGEWDNV